MTPDRAWGLSNGCSLYLPLKCKCSALAPGESTPVSGTDFSMGEDSGAASFKQASSGVRSIGMAARP